jgi:hypothetical protein
MTAPIRLRLSRAKGFHLQAASLAANGLPAVKVDRSTMWGNPFVPRYGVESEAMRCVALFRAGLTDRIFDKSSDVALARCLGNMRVLACTLRGNNLACWCRLGAPCHADVLLDLANRPICVAA